MITWGIIHLKDIFLGYMSRLVILFISLLKFLESFTSCSSYTHFSIVYFKKIAVLGRLNLLIDLLKTWSTIGSIQKE